ERSHSPEEPARSSVTTHLIRTLPFSRFLFSPLPLSGLTVDLVYKVLPLGRLTTFHLGLYSFLFQRCSMLVREKGRRFGESHSRVWFIVLKGITRLAVRLF